MKKETRIPGAGNRKDTTTKIVFRKNSRISEVFNRVVFRDHPIAPEDLGLEDTAETAVLELPDGRRLPLQAALDVVRVLLRSGCRLAIIGLENQDQIHYLMPFRVLQQAFLNYAMQIAALMERNEAEWTALNKSAETENEGYHPTRSEMLSRFRKDDRILPYMTLVLYYGKEPWNGPLSMKDLFVDSPWKAYAPDYPMYLLDIRRMTEEELAEYSDDLRALFKALKHMNTVEELRETVCGDDAFRKVPVDVLDALAQYMGSEKMKLLHSVNEPWEGEVDMESEFDKMLEEWVDKQAEVRAEAMVAERVEAMAAKRVEAMAAEVNSRVEAKIAAAENRADAAEKARAVEKNRVEALIHTLVNSWRKAQMDENTMIETLSSDYDFTWEQAARFVRA